MLKFNVENQMIKRTDSFLPVADSRNYLKAEFKTSDEWQGAITAVFGYGGCFYRVLLDGDNCCTVPWEVIRAPLFTLSLFCGDESLITANTVEVMVEPSGMKEGTAPSEPTPEIWQQYVSAMQKKIENAVPYIGENGNWYFYNTEFGKYEDSGMLATPEKGVDYFDGKDGTNGKDGETPQKGIDYWTEADKNEIKAYVAPLVVNVAVEDENHVTLDKDVDEISKAYSEGKTVLAYVEYLPDVGEIVAYTQIQILTLVKDAGVNKFRFLGVDILGIDGYSATCLWNEDELVDFDGDILDNGWRIKTLPLSAREYVDEQIGDIEAALDGIIAIQNELIGGDAV